MTRKEGHRDYSIRTTLLVSFLGVTLLLSVLVVVLTNRFLVSGFRTYALERLDETKLSYQAEIEAQYDASTGRFSTTGVDGIAIQALSQGIVLRLENQQGVVLWDAATNDSALCSRMLSHMAMNMKRFDSGFQGGYNETAMAVVSGGLTIGSLHLGYYGPFFLSDADLELIIKLNRLLLLAAAIGLASALAVGFLLSRRLSRPIRSAVRASIRIASGQSGERLPEDVRIREISELDHSLNRLAETLEEQETMRRRLTADVAHELRTPLSALSAQLEMLSEGLREPTPERLKACHEETLRLGALVGDLEGLARAEQPVRSPDFQPVRLDRLSERVVASFEASFEKKSVTLSAVVEPVTIRGESDRLAQVLSNLLSNALRHTPAGGSVKVAVRRAPDGRASLTVEDNGEGIPAADLPHVFERLYRVDRSRNRGTGGAGIGLAIAKAIVEAHRGTLDARSEEGKGSVFAALFPSDMVES